VEWIVRFVRFHGMRSREDLFPAEPKIESFLTDLSVHGHVAAAIISLLGGTTRLVAKLLYGSGLRIMDTVRIRVEDIDCQMKQSASSGLVMTSCLVQIRALLKEV
jgi:integrase